MTDAGAATLIGSSGNKVGKSEKWQYEAWKQQNQQTNCTKT
jgi:hypothetical protein